MNREPHDKTKTEIRGRALALLAAAGVPLNIRRNKMWFDGKSIAAGRRLPAEDMLHEAGHWLMAKPKLRTIRNYGLGPDPNGDTPKKYSSPFLGDEKDGGIDEEVLASGAGILMVAMVGGDHESNLRNHQWDTRKGVTQLQEIAVRLRKRGVKVPKAVVFKVCKTLTAIVDEWEKRMEAR